MAVDITETSKADRTEVTDKAIMIACVNVSNLDLDMRRGASESVPMYQRTQNRQPRSVVGHMSSTSPVATLGEASSVAMLPQVEYFVLVGDSVGFRDRTGSGIWSLVRSLAR